LDAVVSRDVKGLYAKALSGEISNFTGISDPFEEPATPDLVIETDKNTLHDCVTQLYEFVVENI
jgi:adenylylsulfate kinase